MKIDLENIKFIPVEDYPEEEIEQIRLEKLGEDKENDIGSFPHFI